MILQVCDPERARYPSAILVSANRYRNRQQPYGTCLKQIPSSDWGITSAQSPNRKVQYDDSIPLVDTTISNPLVAAVLQMLHVHSCTVDHLPCNRGVSNIIPTVSSVTTSGSLSRGAICFCHRCEKLKRLICFYFLVVPCAY